MSSSNKNSILQIGNYKYSSGGISTQMQNLAFNLRKENIVVGILSTRGNVLNRLLVCFKLLLGYNRFSVYHVHGCSGYGFFPIVLGVAIGALKRKRVIVTYHGGMADKFLEKRLGFVKRILSRARVVTVMSEYLHHVFDKYSIATVIVPNTFTPVEIDRPKENLAIQSPVIVSTRTLSETYNILNIIKAYQSIKAEYADAKLVIVGGGPDRKKLEDYIHENGVADVLFTGPVDHKDIYKNILGGTVFVSVSCVDNQPFSILEAFYCGVPVVASNVGGVPDMVKNNASGILVEPMDVAGIVAGIKKLHEDLNVRDKIVSNAFGEIRKYLWPNLKNTWLQVYGMAQ